MKLQRHCPAEQGRVILARAREAWADRPVDLTDGVKVRLEEGWFILRASNTEPILRVIAESTTEERARAIAEGILDEILGWLALRRQPVAWLPLGADVALARGDHASHPVDPGLELRVREGLAGVGLRRQTDLLVGGLELRGEPAGVDVRGHGAQRPRRRRPAASPDRRSGVG